MERAVIRKTILDQLIREKLATMPECAQVEPMPVAWCDRRAAGCNWYIPGWVGDAGNVKRCTDHLAHYLSLLQGQFDIPEEREPRPQPRRRTAD